MGRAGSQVAAARTGDVRDLQTQSEEEGNQEEEEVMAEKLIDQTERVRNLAEQGFPQHTTLGGYPIVYYTADAGELCAACARGENGSEATLEETEDTGPDDWQWLLADADVYYEGPVKHCEHCDAEIESAYGDPDEEERI